MARPLPPASFSAVARAASRRMSLTTTSAPSSAKRSAMARPMPEPPPVTSATFPSSLIPLSPDPHGLVDVRVLAEVRHDLLGEELHHLERLLVGAAVHAGAHDAGLQLVGEHTQLVAHGGRAPADDVAAL